MHEQRMEGGHHVQTALLSDPCRAFACRLEVLTVLYQLDTERAHRCVLLGAVAMRNHDGGGNGVLMRGEGYRLAMVAARRADDAGGFAAASGKVTEINQSAAQLERPDGGVVFVLDPDFRAGPGLQQRPR